MKSFWAVYAKEWREVIRTYRLFLLSIVLLALAIMSPATAYFMADILEAAGINVAALADPSIQSPTYLASFEQFFKNIGQIGLLVLAIVFAGLVANDISKQTIVPFVAKGLSRSTIILAKYAASVMVWLLTYVAAVAVMFAYTAYYFDIANAGELVVPLVGMFVFGMMLLALVMLGGVMFKNQIGALLVAGGFVVIATLVNVFLPKAEVYNPIILTTHNVAAAAGTYPMGDFASALYVGLGTVIAGVILSLVLFRKTEF